VIIDFTDIEAYRRFTRDETALLPRVLPDLPSGTYERIPLPTGAPLAELMLYRPAGVVGLPPVFVNLHGGGFAAGEWETDDPYCRLLADGAGCAVINLDYLLAPEHKFPEAIQQTYALLAWLQRHGSELGLDGDRLAVGGHSAGGGISAAVSLLATERAEVRLRGQILDYAPLDLATSPNDKPNPDVVSDPDMVEWATRIAVQYNEWYLSDPTVATSPLASPVLAPDLAGLPPALVITAEYDVLRAEADTYAARLAAAGVETEHVSYPGCGHGFTHFGPEEPAVDAWRRMTEFLVRVLA